MSADAVGPSAFDERKRGTVAVSPRHGADLPNITSLAVEDAERIHPQFRLQAGRHGEPWRSFPSSASMRCMNQAHALTDLISGGELLAADPDVGDPEDFLKRAAASLATLKGHHALALVAAPPASLPDMPRSSGKSLRMFVSAVDDPVVDRAEEYLQRLMPDDVRLPAPAVLTQMLRNVRLRVAFLETHEAWTAGQVAQFAGSTAKNASALAGRWRAEKQVFAVDLENELLYPAFQFDPATRKPKPVIRRVLAVFAERQASPWEIALWFANNRRGGGDVPLAALDSAPEEVVAAAEGVYRPVL
jgi:hypothetical protein